MSGWFPNTLEWEAMLAEERLILAAAEAAAEAQLPPRGLWLSRNEFLECQRCPGVLACGECDGAEEWNE